MLKDWLKLLYLSFVSPAHKRALVTHFGSPTKLFAASKNSLVNFGCLSHDGIAAILGAENTQLDNDIQLLESIGAKFVGFNQPEFPDLLNEIITPPLGLFIKGNIKLLKRHQIAIVGSRNASPAGKKTTEQFAAELTRLGFTITSGMAAGIDSHAHLGSLSVGKSTIAVMGTGIDQIYPHRNRALYNEITKNGLVVSEFPPRAIARPEYFPQRNRIISGLSLGTLVVEAGMRSGSLITARLAAEQGREVFAIPGSIHSPTSRGCHYLIRQGAKLVESVSDITDEIEHFFENSTHYTEKEYQAKQSTSEHPIYKLIDYSPISIDHLIETSGLTTEQVSSILIELELQGLIAETNGGYQRLPQ